MAQVNMKLLFNNITRIWQIYLPLVSYIMGWERVKKLSRPHELWEEVKENGLGRMPFINPKVLVEKWNTGGKKKKRPINGYCPTTQDLHMKACLLSGLNQELLLASDSN